MVDLKEHNLIAKDYTETITIGPDNIPTGTLEILRTDLVEIKSGVSAGQTKLVIECKNKKGDIYTYWPNKTSNKFLAEKFGMDTDDWIGKKFTLSSSKQVVRGERRTVIYAEPA